MGIAIETIGFNTLNPGATFTAASAATGDSLAIRSFDIHDGATLEGIACRQGTAGAVRVRSPRFHDNVNGIRYNVTATDPIMLSPDWLSQPVEPVDTLIVEQTGGGAETEVGALWIYYNNLAGSNARIYRWEEIKPRIVNYAGVFVNPTSSATIGAWGPGRTLNADVDNLKAGVDYALLGVDVDTSVVCVSIKGADTGNYRIGIPGSTNRTETRDWFIRNATRDNMPWIPVINAANKGGILVDVLHNAASQAVNINFLFAELRP